MAKKIQWTKYVSNITKFFDKFKGNKKKSLFLQGQQGIVFGEDAPDKKFKIYEGDSNFVITETDFKKISRVKGIEAVTVVTPYKLRVGIAKLFDENEVLLKIDNLIDPFNNVHKEIIDYYQDKAKSKFIDFIIYEDMYKMIHISDEMSKDNICDGFLILDSKDAVRGV